MPPPARSSGASTRSRDRGIRRQHGRGPTLPPRRWLVWVTGTYDPEQNLVFGTGNPGPDYYSANREGDNLFTASIVALDADTEKLGGTINSRRTTCTTGTPHRCRCWRAADQMESRARW